MSSYPFTQTEKGDRIIREFDRGVNSEELVWHRDAENRKVFVVSGEGWQLQMENKLPSKLVPGQTYSIPKNTYHRIIKGRTGLTVEIKEVRSLNTKTENKVRTFALVTF